MAEGKTRPKTRTQLAKELITLRRQVSELTRAIETVTKVERALQESEARFRALYDENPAMYFSVGPDGTILSVNQHGAQVLGYGTEELVGRSVLRIFHEDDRDMVQRQLSACVQEPQVVHQWVFRKLRKDGSMLWVREDARVVQGPGTSPVVLIVCEDITVLKDTERALRESEQRYALATAEARIGVWDWDLRTGAFYLDPNIKAILGYSDDEVKNDLNEWMQFVHPEDLEEAMEAARAHLEGRTAQYVHEHRMRHKDGSLKWILVRGTAQRDATGQAVRMIGTDMDITERKQAEESLWDMEQRRVAALRQSDALKSALLASISHEFRTPLACIQSSLETLLKSPRSVSPSVREEMGEGIIREMGYLTQLVENLLQMSKIEAGALMLNREWHPFEDVLEAALRRLAAALKGRQLEMDMSPTLSPIFIDAVQIQHVLINLLDNAAKYSDGGTPIRISARGNDHELEVRLSSVGEVIPPDDLTRIFDRFYRREGHQRSTRGSGLGLAICRGLIEGHGGRSRAREAIPSGRASLPLASLLRLHRPMPAGSR